MQYNVKAMTQYGVGSTCRCDENVHTGRDSCLQTGTVDRNTRKNMADGDGHSNCIRDHPDRGVSWYFRRQANRICAKFVIIIRLSECVFERDDMSPMPQQCVAVMSAYTGLIKTGLVDFEFDRSDRGISVCYLKIRSCSIVC